MCSYMSLLRPCVRTTAPRLAWARPIEHIPATSKRLIYTPRTSILIRPSIVVDRARLPSTARFESSASTPPQNTSIQAPESRLDRDQVPSYELTFTCNVCKTRSSHRLSKQGYHKGTILISCPDCKNRHLISDHLKIFSDKSITIEDLMKEKGGLVKRGSLSAEGDVEFWDDGSSTPRSAHFHTHASPAGEERLTDKNQPPTDTPKE
ncbi:DNL zinc finger domain-containing protein [Didymella exigua CBS 183.55]|uniref:DNL zinc finger domain-containing protein n=1 Tax=Didymella exigua CBS 183.55 TaxID=1150837 RepID=A0A6A5RV58_9PLEO|nr:DNL zinc finger domain-containing protein [Didymella exigua CBS 183.55]KAF1931752.1 DNL zinc finger domain-containing protein [Didymella exigua CBS 183.55]